MSYGRLAALARAYREGPLRGYVAARCVCPKDWSQRAVCLSHLCWLCDNITAGIFTDNLAQQRLGFVQGNLVALGLLSLEETQAGRV